MHADREDDAEEERGEDARDGGKTEGSDRRAAESDQDEGVAVRIRGLHRCHDDRGVATGRRILRSFPVPPHDVSDLTHPSAALAIQPSWFADWSPLPFAHDAN